MPVAALTVVSGEEELLVERAIGAVVAAVRSADPAAAVDRVDATTVDGTELAQLLSPSLFADRRVVVLTDVQEAPPTVLERLAVHAGETDPATVVVALRRGAKGKAGTDRLRAAGAAAVDCPTVRWTEDRLRFVQAEADAAGGTITPDAARELLAAVAGDLRELAGAVAQLVADSGGTVDSDVVARYHRGRADATAFLVADRALEGDAAGALELLRWGLATGVAPAAVTGALASNLRTLALVATAARGESPPGVPAWKVKKVRAWSRGWQPDRLAAAVRAVATADAAVKGAVAEPGYVLERAVLTVSAGRGGG